MKKLCFVAVLMLALAAPAMAQYSGSGSIGDYCLITGANVNLILGGPSDTGQIVTPNNPATVNANKDCTIECQIAAGGVADRVIGPGSPPHSLAAIIYWQASSAATLAVAAPQVNAIHLYDIEISRGGLADPSGAYSGTITLLCY